MLLQPADGGKLLNGCVNDLCKIRRLTVDAAVDAVSEILLDLCLHHAHRADGRADGSQEVLDVVALLKIQDTAAAARQLLRTEAYVQQQRIRLPADLIVRGDEL